MPPRRSATTFHAGPVRVRREPPTVDEAIAAASDLSDDLAQIAEIAASFLGVTEAEVRERLAQTGVPRKAGARSETIQPEPQRGRIPARPIVVERIRRRPAITPGR